MAVDQVSLCLYPPRWEMRSEASPWALHVSGEPVRVISDVRVDSSDGPTIAFEAVRRWFVGRDFAIVTDGPDYALWESAAVPSFSGHQPEISVSAGGESGELTSLYCRFLVNRDAPAQLELWDVFMQEVCATFRLRIGVADGEFAGPEKFPQIVRHSDAWRYFAGSLDGLAGGLGSDSAEPMK